MVYEMVIFIERWRMPPFFLHQSNKPKIPNRGNLCPGLGSHILPI